MATCPRCARGLVDAPVAGRPARTCPCCGGQALTVPVFRDSVPKPVFRALQAAWSAGGTPSGLPCPGCGKALNLLAGQPAAACRPCQLLWFDAGERPTPLPSPRREPDLPPEALRVLAEAYVSADLDRREAREQAEGLRRGATHLMDAVFGGLIG
jgi:hypothetical protein